MVNFPLHTNKQLISGEYSRRVNFDADSRNEVIVQCRQSTIWYDTEMFSVAGLIYGTQTQTKKNTTKD